MGRVRSSLLSPVTIATLLLPLLASTCGPPSKPETLNPKPPKPSTLCCVLMVLH